MPYLRVDVSRYTYIIFEVGEGAVDLSGIGTNEQGEMQFLYSQIVYVPDDVNVTSLYKTGSFAPTLLEFLIAAGAGLFTIQGGGSILWQVIEAVTEKIIFEVVADRFEFEVIVDDVIKTKDVQIVGKGVIDIGQQLNIRKDGEIWLWRGIININSYDESITDPIYSNPHRHYFGLATLSYFGNTHKPYWIRTANHYLDIHTITPNYAGKSGTAGIPYPNLVYTYPRADRLIYDLRSKVVATFKVTAVKLFEGLTSWW